MKLMKQGQLDTGTLTSFLLYTLTIAMAVAFVASLFGDFMTSVVSVVCCSAHLFHSSYQYMIGSIRAHI